MGDIPKFETLIELAQRDPEALEKFRQMACQQFIATTPCTHHQRLAAVQNRVEWEIRRAKSPMAGLIKVSGMMHDSLYQLSSKWIEFNSVSQRTTDSSSSQTSKSAKIINFVEWKDRLQQRQGSLH